MYNRSPSRNHRSRGFKVKHILQICLLVAVCFWLIYQVKHSHEKRKEFGENGGKLASETHDGKEVLRLGRKDISTVTEADADDKSLGKDVEENEANVEDEQVEEDMRKGASDDEIDEHGVERIDDENHDELEGAEKEREEIDENNEDNQEVETVLEDHEQDQEGGDEVTHGAREQHYKGDDASSEVAQDTGIIIPDIDNATIKHTDENAELISDGKKNVTQNSNEQLLKENPEGANSPYSASLMSSNLTKTEIEYSSNMTQAQNATHEENHSEASNMKMNLFSKGNNTDSVSGENQLDMLAAENSTQHVNNTSEGSLGSSGEVKLPTADNATESVLTKTDDGVSANTDTNKIQPSNSENIMAAGGTVSDTNVDTSAADPRDHKGDFGPSLLEKEKEGLTDLDASPEIKLEVQRAGEVEAE